MGSWNKNVWRMKHSITKVATRFVAFFAVVILMRTGLSAQTFITFSATYEYNTENLHYKLKYKAPDSLWLHYNDTVVSMSSADARKFAALSASFFGKKGVVKKSDTITSNAPIIDISIECAPRIEDKGLVMQTSISRQPTYKYSPEFIALEHFVEDATAPYIYMSEGIWEPGRVESYPEYIGGYDALASYIVKNLQLPKELDNSCIIGKVILKIEVTSAGCVGKIKVYRTPHELLSEEIIRVVRTLSEECFIPAKRKGVAVSCWFTFPVNIHMQ